MKQVCDSHDVEFDCMKDLDKDEGDVYAEDIDGDGEDVMDNDKRDEGEGEDEDGDDKDDVILTETCDVLKFTIVGDKLLVMFETPKHCPQLASDTDC